MGEMTFESLQAAWRVDQASAIAKAVQELPSPPTPTPDPEKPDPGTASMGAVGVGGLVESLDGFKIPVLNVAVPLASILVGGGTGLLYGNLVDKFAPPQSPEGKTNWVNPLLQVVGVGAALTMGPKLMGGMAAKFAAGSIVTRLALHYTPLGTWLQKLEDILSKPFNPSSSTTTPRGSGVVSQAEAIVRASNSPYAGTGL